jgi:hypothetical protein
VRISRCVACPQKIKMRYWTAVTACTEYWRLMVRIYAKKQPLSKFQIALHFSKILHLAGFLGVDFKF